MNAPIIIIGSGFGSYQLIKTIRRTNTQQPITVFTLDEGHDYNKPDLSHVFSHQQTSNDLIRQSAQEFAAQYNITLHALTRVDSIDSQQQRVWVNDVAYPYSQLVLATGAKTFVPPMQGNATHNVMTLNSLQEFASAQQQLHEAKRVMLIGAGLIGTEIAMDLSHSGKHVVVVDPSKGVMTNMLPDLIASALQTKLTEAGVKFEFSQTVTALNQNESTMCATLSSGTTHDIDCVISAAGLKPNVALATQTGLEVNNGIVVNHQLQTSVNNIYALGDCAEINGKVMSYLQPILLSANALAKTLLGQPTTLSLPAMLVKVKTPQMPIQLGGNTVKGVSSWQVDIDANGCSVKAFNEQKQIIGFVVTQGHMNNTFPLLRALPANF
ncbi:MULTISPECIES: NADH:flavorubredoxin reductase NorW [Shewanella]|uniref:NADH:flavorubredoxin reductase NorW n=1 Tax=Shewanella metallivivens TaxID=2872342 RepID=A0ABT5TIU2_9GAMM|nr:NADH:flavorubredoxin reductase NorW [Shewanella metallivivens]MDD8057824.1 NADH:flavorubredoxin reductase NorW [Shewanella metallivivens]